MSPPITNVPLPSAGQVLDGREDCAVALIVFLSGEAVAIRADRLRLSPWSEAATEAAGLVATVTDVEYQGAIVQTSLTATDGSELVAVASEEAFDRDPVKPGTRVAVAWDAEDAHVLT